MPDCGKIFGSNLYPSLLFRGLKERSQKRKSQFTLYNTTTQGIFRYAKHGRGVTFWYQSIRLNVKYRGVSNPWRWKLMQQYIFIATLMFSKHLENISTIRLIYAQISRPRDWRDVEIKSYISDIRGTWLLSIWFWHIYIYISVCEH